MIGPVANSVCIVAGSILGALCGPVLSQEFRKKIMNVFSCITLGIGVTMLSKGDSLPPVVLSLLFGTALGELTRFESLVMKGAFKVAGLFKRNGKAKDGKSETLSETVFRDQFAVATGPRCSCRTPRRPCLRISPLAAASSCSARGCVRWGLCRSLSSVCCPVCFSSCRCPHYGSRLCR